ncbi:MAG: threonylcarbamoyl-AMP synthase [Alphaproteobacteria bacterium]|nr:threonylcarbamoyl-AMP synthase [Alphaproteobacteria bacterium]
MTFKIDYTLIPKVLQKACDLLHQGEVVAMPTETVYGLAADATNGAAITKVYELKNRPSFNPLIVHFPDHQSAEKYARFSKMAQLLANHFWNSAHHRPLTLVLPRLENTNLSHLATAGLDTVAVRVPSHPIALELLRQFGKPLAAPSANPSNNISPTTAEHVRLGFGDRAPFILDGGPCQVGVESTILDMTTDQPALLRPGGATVEEIEEVLKIPILKSTNPSAMIKAPGMLKRHYAPSLPLRLNVIEPLENEAFLGFGPAENVTLNLSLNGNLSEATSNLFSMLKDLDNPKFKGIAVMPIPSTGLGLAINDRLNRAASKE